MGKRLRLNTQVGIQLAADSEAVADPSNRTFLRAAGLRVASPALPQARGGKSPQAMMVTAGKAAWRGTEHGQNKPVYLSASRQLE
jgi:hypothetical protein